MPSCLEMRAGGVCAVVSATPRGFPPQLLTSNAGMAIFDQNETQVFVCWASEHKNKVSTSRLASLQMFPILAAAGLEICAVERVCDLMVF